jgi:ribose/xylose/arabinose/galactoside ABC-type transport system permease subunit
MNRRNLGPLAGLVLAWIFFAAVAGPSFFSFDNQRLMLLQSAVVALAAVGATLVILTGGIDLAVGSVIALSTMVAAWLLKEAGLPPAAAALGTVMVGLAVGALTGALVNFGLTPFIVTLGTWGALRGLAKGLGDNQPIYPDQTWLTGLMQSGGALAPGVWMAALACLLGVLLLRYTRFGRHVVAVGSNEKTARLCGIHVERVKLGVYALAAGLASVAGLLQFAFLLVRLTPEGTPSAAETDQSAPPADDKQPRPVIRATGSGEGSIDNFDSEPKPEGSARKGSGGKA